MSNIEISFHPEATSEYIASYKWYYERGIHLASAFEKEVERGLRLISDAPGRWPVYAHKYNKLPVKRFPFVIIYKYTGAKIIIMAIAHTRRKPGYWKKRDR